MKKLVLATLVLLYSVLAVSQLTGPNYFDDPDDDIREYYLYIPDDLPPNSPIVYVFHGWGGNALGVSSYTSFMELSDIHKFVVCYPNALIDGDGGTSGLTSWNTNGLSDVDFVFSLHDHLSNEYQLDPNRVFATGFSYGAEMSHHLARCQENLIFSAIAPVGGSIFDYMDICSPSHQVSVFVLHGTTDYVIEYNGGTYPDYGDYMSIPDVVDTWVADNSCELNENYTLPDLNTDTAGPVNVEKYLNDTDDTKVWFYSIVDLGHVWPSLNVSDIDASEEIWDFFMEVSGVSTTVNETTSSKNKTLIKTTDVLGKEVSRHSKNQITIYIYDDGTVEKKFEIP